jgi:NADPH2:quinone reductase
VTAGSSADDIVDMVQSLAPDGIDHIVEVAFHANIGTNERLLKQGGSIATYASGNPTPTIPFWPLVFKNISVHFLGSDDFPVAAKTAAAAALNGELEAGWPGFEIVPPFPLESVAEAHETVEAGSAAGISGSRMPQHCGAVMEFSDQIRFDL